MVNRAGFRLDVITEVTASVMQCGLVSVWVKGFGFWLKGFARLTNRVSGLTALFEGRPTVAE